MRLDFYGADLKRKSAIYSWISLLWLPKYNTAGSFQLEVQYEKELFNLIKPFDYVTFDQDDAVMMITGIRVEKQKIIINGRDAVYILNYRASDVVIRRQNAEQAMHALVNSMTPWDNFAAGDIRGYTDKFDAQVSDGSILSYCETISNAVDMGFRVIFAHDALKFECYKPSSTLYHRFSPKLGNIGEEKYVENEDGYYNVAVVAGGVIDNQRITVSTGAVDLTGTERREIYIDARQEQKDETETMAEYEDRLRLFGDKKLSETVKSKSISFSIKDEDIKLGDAVLLQSSYLDTDFKSRVIGKTIKVQQNTIKREISIGTLTPMPKRSV